MKQMRMTVIEAQELTSEIVLALVKHGLDANISIDGLSDPNLRVFAEIIRETVIEFEERRIEANRKPRAAKPAKV